jgi:hypothetical protein
MALELENSVATLKHINARKEGPEEDKELSIDIKLEIDEAAVDILPQFDPALRGFLFDKDMVRFPAMDEIKWHGEHLNMEIELCGFVFIGARLSKFSIQPYINERGQDREEFTGIQRVVITCSASFKPCGAELATIAELLGEETKISIRARQQELELAK